MAKQMSCYNLMCGCINHTAVRFRILQITSIRRIGRAVTHKSVKDGPYTFIIKLR